LLSSNPFIIDITEGEIHGTVLERLNKIYGAHRKMPAFQLLHIRRLDFYLSVILKEQSQVL